MITPALLSPRSVVIVGASADARRLAGRPLLRMRQHDFPGQILLVNPRHTAIADTPCFPSVSALPHPVDLALITVPAPAVPGVIEECGRRGIGNAVVLSSGFEEDSGGAELTKRLVSAVRSSGVRLVGPNCEGIWNIPGHMALTFGSAADRPQLLAGDVSVISQSGSIGAACMRELQDRGVGCRYFVSTGNETDQTALDFLEYMVDEGASRVVALFVEALGDGHRLRAIGRRALAAGIRILVLQAGSSTLGRAATLSHTGRMASTGAVYRDLLRQAGVVEVPTLSDLIAATETAALCPALPTSDPGSTGVGVIAISGGSRALIADSCAARGVAMAEFTPATEQRLAELLPQFGYTKNPADVTGRIVDNPEIFAAVASAIIDDPHTDALFVQYANGSEHQVAAHVTVLAELQRRTGKPVLSSLLGTISPAVHALLRDAALVHAGDPDEAVKRLAWLHRFAASTPVPVPPGPAASAPLSAGGEELLTWHSRMALLEAADIAVPRWTILPPDAHPGQHLVAKALPEAGEHKTEQGLVRLDLRDPSALDTAVAELRGALGPDAGILLQEMARGGLELLVALRRDPDFGPILVIGAGGVHTEWLADLGYVQLPATTAEIESALGRLRIRQLFEPHRGTPRRDLRAFLDALSRLAECYLRRVPENWEVEINPMMVFEAGRGVCAVDILCAPQSKPSAEN